MLLVKLKPTTEGYDDTVYLLVAIYDDEQWIIDDSNTRYYPHQYSKDELEIVYGDVPQDWKKVVGKNYTIESFEDWADDPYFYYYLVDGNDKRKLEEYQEKLAAYTKKCLEDYALSAYSSSQDAIEKVSDWYWKNDAEYRRARGWQQSDKFGAEIELTFDNIYRSSHNERPNSLEQG